MERCSAAQARGKLGSMIKKVAEDKERVVITHRGKDLAALVPIEDARFLEELEDRLDLEEARADPEKSIPWETLKAELGL
jgi:prevent-host-death family protein